MILYGDSEGIAKRCINVVLRKARNGRVVELDIFKDEVARAVFLKGHVQKGLVVAFRIQHSIERVGGWWGAIEVQETLMLSL